MVGFEVYVYLVCIGQIMIKKAIALRERWGPNDLNWLRGKDGILVLSYPAFFLQQPYSIFINENQTVTSKYLIE